MAKILITSYKLDNRKRCSINIACESSDIEPIRKGLTRFYCAKRCLFTYEER